MYDYVLYYDRDTHRIDFNTFKCKIILIHYDFAYSGCKSKRSREKLQDLFDWDVAEVRENFPGKIFCALLEDAKPRGRNPEKSLFERLNAFVVQDVARQLKKKSWLETTGLYYHEFYFVEFSSQNTISTEIKL
jgi:hypothetical protein